MPGLVVLALGLQPASVVAAEPAWTSGETASSDGPPDRQVQTVRRHDGFFARGALGPGYFWAANKSLSASGDRRVFQGGTASLQLAMGGTTRAGFVNLGGAYFRDQVYALSYEDRVIDGDEPDLDGYDLSLQSLGFFADVYLDPESGTHLQALLARSWLVADSPTGGSRDNPSGFSLQLGAGHELWVADQVLLGALLNVGYARMKANETLTRQVTMRTLVPSLLLTATVN